MADEETTGSGTYKPGSKLNFIAKTPIGLLIQTSDGTKIRFNVTTGNTAAIEVGESDLQISVNEYFLDLIGIPSETKS
jgi:hypothetical protein